MIFITSKKYVLALAVIIFCNVSPVGCKSNFATTVDYLINSDRNEIEYNALNNTNESVSTSSVSDELSRESSEPDNNNTQNPDHGLILLDVTSQNLAGIYAKYGISSTGIIVLESRISSELRFGDRIVLLNGQKIYSSAGFNSKIKENNVGDSVCIGVDRDGVIIEINLTLEEKIPDWVTFD